MAVVGGLVMHLAAIGDPAGLLVEGDAEIDPLAQVTFQLGEETAYSLGIL